MSIEKKGGKDVEFRAAERPVEDHPERNREVDRNRERPEEGPEDEIQEARMAVEAAVPEAAITAVKQLSPEEKKDFYKQLEIIKDQFKAKRPSILAGGKIDAEYDCHVRNYSTQTKVITLENGRKLFAVFNYPTSWIHRKLDGFMKWATGAKMAKVDSEDWKETYEDRTQIPTIDNNDPNLVVMDYLPNINLYDLVVNRSLKDKDGNPLIKDFGECKFAEGMNEDDLLRVLEKVTDKIKQMHEAGIQWGEANLPNMIIDKDQEVHICDPETKYDPKVPVPERQARDIFVLILSSAAAMKKSQNTDYSRVVKSVLDKYHLDEATRVELKKLADKKMTLGQRLFFGYTKENLGLKDKNERQDILKAVSQYLG